MANLSSHKAPETVTTTTAWYIPFATTPWCTPLVISAVLAMNNALQSIGTKHKVLRTISAKYTSVLRTMPFICLADALLLVLDVAIAICRRLSFRRVVADVVGPRRDDQNGPAARKTKKFDLSLEELANFRDSADRGDRNFFRLTMGVLALTALVTLSIPGAFQALAFLAFTKLYSVPDSSWTKTFAIMLAVSKLPETVINLLERYMAPPEAMGDGAPCTTGEKEKETLYEAETTSEPEPWKAQFSIVDDLLGLMSFIVMAVAVVAQVLLWSYCLGPLGYRIDENFDVIMWPAELIPILTTLIVICFCSTLLLPFTMTILIGGFLVDVGLCLVIPAALLASGYGICLRWPRVSAPVRWLADVFDVKTRSLVAAMIVPTAVAWSAFQVQKLGFCHVSPISAEWFAWSMGWMDWAIELALKKKTQRCAAGFWLLFVTFLPISLLYQAVTRVIFDGSLSEGRPWKSYKVATQGWLKYALLWAINVGATLYHFCH